MLLNFYFGKTSKITSLVNLLEENTVLKSYRLTNSDYIFKMKNLLISAALGMVPSKERD
jgi:hypothetical protein